MDKIDQFIKIWLDFSLKLHERQGIDEVLFAEMIQLLQDIDVEYRAKDHIPKKLAEILSICLLQLMAQLFITMMNINKKSIKWWVSFPIMHGIFVQINE